MMGFCEAVFKSVGLYPRIVYTYQDIDARKDYPQMHGRVSCPIYSRAGTKVGYIAIQNNRNVNVGLTRECRVTDFIMAAKIAVGEYKNSLLSVA